MTVDQLTPGRVIIAAMWEAFRLAVALGALVTAARAADAAPPRFELGGFSGVDYFGDDIELGNSWADEQKPGTAALLGLRLGYVALPDLTGAGAGGPRLALGAELEAKLALASTGDSSAGDRMSYSSPVIGWRGHVIARVDGLAGRLSPHLVIGGGGETISTSSPFMADETDPVFYYGVGASIDVTRRLAVRLDGRHGLTAGRDDRITSTFELQVGMVVRFELGGGRGGGGATPRPVVVVPDPVPENPDQDGDGLLDRDDGCPFDAEDANAIDDADGCPDKDDDADGVLGSGDACAAAAEDRDGFQDDDGCPELDNDGDGLDDMHDTCPTEAEATNGYLDDDGCADELPAAARALEGPLRGVTFARGKAKLGAAAKRALAPVVAVLRELPALRLQIESHAADVALAQRRADAVKWYLVDQGVADDRLETAGVASATAKSTAGIELHLIGTAAAQPAPAPAAPTPTPTPTPAP
jgi:outer membrane protein OmpA-like peptidoglycan-associated protein/opacity protein-like surface antigen